MSTAGLEAKTRSGESGLPLASWGSTSNQMAFQPGTMVTSWFWGAALRQRSEPVRQSSRSRALWD